MVFVPGNVQTTIKGAVEGIAFFARVTTDTEINEGFAIGNLSQLLSVLKICDDPEIIVKDKKKLIVEDSKRKIEIPLVPASFVKYAEKPEKFLKPDTTITFKLTENDFYDINKFGSIFKTDHIVLSGDDNGIYITSTDCSNPTSDNSIIKLGDSIGETFKAVIKKENATLFGSDYEVSISRKGFIHFSNEDLEYFIPVERNFSQL